MTTAIQEYNATEAALSELRGRFAATVWVVDTRERLENAKKARAEIRKWRTDLEAERKRIKVPALTRCREIDSEARRITDEFLALEKPVDEAIKAVERAKELEREEKKKAEAEKAETLRAEIEFIQVTLPMSVVGESSERIQKAIEKLSLHNSSCKESKAACVVTLKKLNMMHHAETKREREREILALERAKVQRQKEEQEAAEDELRERLAKKEEQARAEREKADAEAREIRAEQDQKARKALEAEETRLRAEREKAYAEMEREARDAESEITDITKGTNSRTQIEKDRFLDGRIALTSFVEDFGYMIEFSLIVGEINAFLRDVEELDTFVRDTE